MASTPFIMDCSGFTEHAFGNGSLSRECPGKCLEVAKLLLELNANVDEKDHRGCTPLGTAARMGNTAMVQLLASKGADVNCTQHKYENSPICIAAMCGHRDTVLALRVLGAHLVMGDFFIIAQWGDEKVIGYLIEAGVDFWLPGRESLLHTAAMTGNNSVLKKLLESHLIDVNAGDSIESTPLHNAVCRGNLSTVQILVEYGALINSRDAHGATPFFLATYWNKTDVAEFLESKGGHD